MATGASRRTIFRVLIGMLLFAQMVVTAYACPVMLPVASAYQDLTVVSSRASAADKGDSIALLSDEASDSANIMAAACDQMDRAAPNLCAEHCHFGQQSADHPRTPVVPGILITGLYLVPLQSEATKYSMPLSALENPTAAVSPPHAILHCCFRI